MGHEKTLLFDVRPLLPCFVPTANGKAEDDDENNINITLLSSQTVKSALNIAVTLLNAVYDGTPIWRIKSVTRTI